MNKPCVDVVFVPCVFLEIRGEKQNNKNLRKDGGLAGEVMGFMRQERITPLATISSEDGTYKIMLTPEDADLVRDVIETTSLADVECFDDYSFLKEIR